ncbi:MAG: LexA family protein [bacterium]
MLKHLKERIEEEKRKFGENLSKLLDAIGLSQEDVARHLGVSVQAVRYYVEGRSVPREGKLSKLAKLLGVDEGVFFDAEGAESLANRLRAERILGDRGLAKALRDRLVGPSWEGIVEIPVVGTAVAGEPILIEENIVDTLRLPSDLVGGGDEKTFALRIEGDSMVGAAILPGDYVFVHQQPTVENGDVAVVALDDEEGTVKRVFFEGGRVRLHPENDAMKDVVVGANRVRIIGKVTARFGSVR